MAIATFDTLKFANTLKAAGVPDKQAEAQASAFAEVIQINLKELVTKEDLSREITHLRDELKQEFKDVRKEIEDLREELKREIKDESQKLSTRIDVLAAKFGGEMLLLKWMLGATLTAVMGIFIRLFFFQVQ